MLDTPDDNTGLSNQDRHSVQPRRMEPVGCGILTTAIPDATGVSRHHLLSNATPNSHGMNDFSNRSRKMAWKPANKPLSITGMSAQDVISLWYPGVTLKTTKEETRALLDRQALRWPVLRLKYKGGAPNLTKDINIQAICVQIVGDLAEQPCGHCLRGHGNFDKCVRLSGWSAVGACANCCFNNDPTRCNFHGKPRIGAL